MSTSPSVEHYPDEQRYELRLGEAQAILTYELESEKITYTHTFVPVELRGQGIAEKLVKVALAEARANKHAVIPQCSYVGKYITRHSEYQDLLAPGQ
jgi:predicted GNAT family acetyltransferase